MPMKMSHGSKGERTGRREGVVALNIYGGLCHLMLQRDCRFVAPAYNIHDLLITAPSFNLKCYR